MLRLFVHFVLWGICAIAAFGCEPTPALLSTTEMERRAEAVANHRLDSLRPLWLEQCDTSFERQVQHKTDSLVRAYFERNPPPADQ